MDVGGAAEAMDEDVAAATFDEGAALLPPAKDASPPRGPGARGMKSARAARPDPEVRNSADKPARRVASTRRLPRAAATNNTAVDMFRAGGTALPLPPRLSTAMRRAAPAKARLLRRSEIDIEQSGRTHQSATAAAAWCYDFQREIGVEAWLLFTGATFGFWSPV